MTWQSELQQILHSKALTKRAWQGAGIAFVLMIIFLLIANSRDLVFETWELLPLLAVTVGGAAGGIFYCLMDPLRNQGGGQRVLANVLSVLVYFLSLYCCLILALNAVGQWD